MTTVTCTCLALRFSAAGVGARVADVVVCTGATPEAVLSVCVGVIVVLSRTVLEDCVADVVVLSWTVVEVAVVSSLIVVFVPLATSSTGAHA